MSLILDALKRAERDRQAGPSAALEDLPAGRAPRTRRRWGRWLGLALLAVAGIAVTVSVMREPKRPPSIPGAAVKPAPQARPATPAPQAAVPAPAPAPAPLPIPARPAPAVIPGTEGVASLDDLTQGSAEEPLAPATAPPAEPAAAAAEGPEAAPDRDADVEAEPEPEPPPKRQAAPAPAEPPPPAIPPALTQRAPVRKLREMPPEYRADFPVLTVEVHVFEPGRRFVMVNGRRYREGERLAEGPQIVEIVRDGIVLDYRGEKVLFTLGR